MIFMLNFIIFIISDFIMLIMVRIFIKFIMLYCVLFNLLIFTLNKGIKLSL